MANGFDNVEYFAIKSRSLITNERDFSKDSIGGTNSEFKDSDKKNSMER
jgi:hypothetical protein